MPTSDELPADDPKSSADNLDNINEGSEDHSQSIPPGHDDAAGGPSVADAFRSGS